MSHFTNNIMFYSLFIFTLSSFTLLSCNSQSITSNSSCSSSSNITCEECVSKTSCFYCFKSKECLVYDDSIFSSPHGCDGLSQASWGLCFLNMQQLFITIGVTSGLILISFICCCCKCCSKWSQYRRDRDMMRWERIRDERRIMADDRRMERQSRMDEMRAKYGIGNHGNDIDIDYQTLE